MQNDAVTGPTIYGRKSTAHAVMSNITVYIIEYSYKNEVGIQITKQKLEPHQTPFATTLKANQAAQAQRIIVDREINRPSHQNRDKHKNRSNGSIKNI